MEVVAVIVVRRLGAPAVRNTMAVAGAHRTRTKAPTARPIRVVVARLKLLEEFQPQVTDIAA